MGQFEELKQLIVGDNAEQLAELKNRLENVERRTQDVAEVLAPAIDAGLREDSGTLVDSLEKPVSLSLKQAIRNEPKEYAEILYPVMAPAISRAISQAISSLLITINQSLESATSISGLRTRFLAMRTGMPYAELALRETLLYRVEHLYLSDRDTGLLIHEVTLDDSLSLDSDAVSAMFSAIQSFVQDSFSQDETARLTDLKVGKYNVWVAHGPKVMLACVISGDAPESLKVQLDETLYRIRTEYANAIANFDGDAAKFEGVDDHMTPLLQQQLKENQNSGSKKPPVAIIPLLLLAFLVGYFGYVWFVNETKKKNVEYYLRQTPGVAVTAVFWEADQLVIEGMQDPDAVVPYDELKARGIDQELLKFKTIPFRSLEVDMELQRFKRELSLPEGVHLGVRDAKVFLYGDAPILWLADNEARIWQLSADRRLTISGLSASAESVSELLQLNFSEADLANIGISDTLNGDFKLIQIVGQMSSEKLALLTALFAGSRWIDVNVSPAAAPSPTNAPQT